MTAGTLALLLAAVQVLPVLEHMAASERWAAAGPEDLFDSSLLPYRVFEWIWPNVFGTFTAGNRYWVAMLPPAWGHRPSPLSLYGGALPVVLALGVAGFRGGPPWRAWMTAVALLSFWASLGEFAGPSRWSGAAPIPTGGDDSFYGLLTTALPALRLFRFPYKLLTFTALGLSALAGLGWDRLASGVDRRRTLIVAVALLLPTIAGLATAADAGPAGRGDRGPGLHPPRLRARSTRTGAAAAIVRSLTHEADRPRARAWPSWPGPPDDAARRRRPRWPWPSWRSTSPSRNSPLVIAIPQADFEHEPEVLRAHPRGRARRPQPRPVPHPAAPVLGPDRLGRFSVEGPASRAGRLGDRHAPARVRLAARGGLRLRGRERGRPHRSAASVPAGDPRPSDAGLAAELGIEPGRRILYHPREVYDLWGARYFIVPSYPGGWSREKRSYAAFVDQTELIYPAPASLAGPEHARDRERWLRDRDVQVRRNRRAFPRAWVVHDARPIRPLRWGPSGPRATPSSPGSARGGCLASARVCRPPGSDLRRIRLHRDRRSGVPGLPTCNPRLRTLRERPHPRPKSRP